MTARWMSHWRRPDGWPRKKASLSAFLAGLPLAQAVKLAQREENAGKLIVVVVPDFGERYLAPSCSRA